ncbi:MAG: hypothetical protein ACLRNQ_03150 [Flavonifractor plautii]
MVLVNSARGQAVFDALSPRFGQVERPLAEAVAGNPRLASPLKANPRRAAFFAAFAALPFAEVEKRFLALLPALPGGGQDAHPGHEGKNPQVAEITAAKCLQFIREFFPAVWYTTLYVTTGRAFRPTGGNFT